MYCHVLYVCFLQVSYAHTLLSTNVNHQYPIGSVGLHETSTWNMQDSSSRSLDNTAYSHHQTNTVCVSLHMFEHVLSGEYSHIFLTTHAVLHRRPMHGLTRMV